MEVDNMANGVMELVDMLYNIISDAWGVPLGAEKCVIKRDEVLDLLDEIKAQMPIEINEAKRLVSARADYISNAKQEAESIRKAAEDQAKRLVDEQAIVRASRNKANEILSKAEERSKELRKMANDYTEDTLKRTEDAITEALNEIKQSRNNFKNAVSTAKPISVPRIEDIDIPEMED
jgi:cell division septum initiation protein DivIVA